ncbi:MAG: TetR/AcrR family transcriptional regulator [Candidatus Kapabacteria bacterium]|nr:TetR/AcrR family transcriptional regulator [Candidatus Kapabacteria bacterium]
MSKKERSERTDSELRSRAIEIALEAFFTVGYSQTTADAIAKELQVSKKRLYQLFPSKEDLLHAVAVHVMQIIEDLTDKLYNDHARPVDERVSALVTQISPHYARFRSPRILKDIQRNAPNVWSEIDAWRQIRYLRFRAIIDDGIAQGEIRTDVGVEDILAVYSVMVNKCMDYATYEDTDVSSVELYRGLMDVFFKGILVSSVIASKSSDHPIEFAPRKEIIREAEALFYRYGYSKTTTDDIAKEAGVSKRTLYERYPRKSDLSLAVLLQAARDLKGLCNELSFDETESYVANLQRLILGYTSVLGRFSIPFMLDLQAHTPATYESLMRWRRRFLAGEIQRALTSGQHLGLIRHDLALTSTVLVLRIAIENLLVPDARASMANVSAPPISAVCSVLLSGISPRTGRSPLQPKH